MPKGIATRSKIDSHNIDITISLCVRTHCAGLTFRARISIGRLSFIQSCLVKKYASCQKADSDTVFCRMTNKMHQAVNIGGDSVGSENKPLQSGAPTYI
jgi:hypothetical protein